MPDSFTSPGWGRPSSSVSPPQRRGLDLACNLPPNPLPGQPVKKEFPVSYQLSTLRERFSLTVLESNMTPVSKMIVSDEVIALTQILGGDGWSHGAEIIADMQSAGRSDACEGAGDHGGLKRSEYKRTTSFLRTSPFLTEITAQSSRLLSRKQRMTKKPGLASNEDGLKSLKIFRKSATRYRQYAED